MLERWNRSRKTASFRDVQLACRGARRLCLPCCGGGRRLGRSAVAAGVPACRCMYVVRVRPKPWQARRHRRHRQIRDAAAQPYIFSPAFVLADAIGSRAQTASFFMPTQDLSLDSINIYGGTQARVKTTDEAIESYADEMTQGATFPPIIVYFDGTTNWLADGFHRYLAAKRLERPSIVADVYPGGRTDALRHALGANATNGVYRNNADKRNAVEIALEEWPDRANPVIAELCRVSVELVRRCRSELARSGKIDMPGKVTGRDGKEYPSQIERQPRGKSEKSSSDESSGGRGGGFFKGKGDGGALGGTSIELEQEARAMIRKGEVNPFQLP